MSYTCLQVTVQPTIPATLIKEEELELLKECFSCEEHSDHDGSVRYYFYTEEYSVYDEKEDEMIGIFQKVIKRSKGELKHIYLQGATYCTKMEPDAFGGMAMFIKKNSVKQISTLEIIIDWMK
jgi:hypothetical protein